MRSYIVRVVVATVLLSVVSLAQTPVKQKFQVFNVSDAVYWTGAGLDTVSSLGKREANPLFRGENGIFSPGKNLLFKSGIWGAFKALEYHYNTPKQRRTISWVKIGAGAVFLGFAVRNFGINKPRGIDK